MLSSSFSPGVELYYTLLNLLIFEIKNNNDEEIVQRANYVCARLLRIFETRRKYIPSDEEIRHIESLKPIMLPIYFFSNSHTFVETESYTTVKEMKQAVMNKLELLVSKVPFYSLYEVCSKESCIEERFVEDNDRIVDILAIWNREAEEFKKAGATIEFRLYLKILIYYEYPEDDYDSITMLYVQNCYDVLLGKLDLEVSEAIELASVQLYVNYLTDRELASKFLEKSISDYVPSNLISQKQPSYWISEILNAYNQIKMISKHVAKANYLKILINNPLYLFHQFNCIVSFYLVKISFQKVSTRRMRIKFQVSLC